MSTEFELASPALCRLHLATEMRRLRLDAELSGSQIVRKLHWSASKLTRLESADNVTVEQDDVRALCKIYGADETTLQTLLAHARTTREKGDWWQAPEYSSLIAPGFSAFLGLEATASALHSYEGDFIPGLLQTEEYVRALYREALHRPSADEVERYVAIRMTRQEALRRAVSPLRFTAVISEAMLHQRVGSGELMRDQLTHLVETAEALPNVRIQVLPFRAGLHPGMYGSFVLLHFPENASVGPVVYQENLVDGWVGRQEGYVLKYSEAFAELQGTASGRQESLQMIKKAIEEH